MSRPRSYVVPNSIIAVRVCLAFLAAALLHDGRVGFAAAGSALIVVSLALDAVDGFAARRLGLASPLGSVLDITADRIVEHVLWVTFAVAGVVPLWVPLLVLTRSFLVDGVRGLAFGRGHTAFGAETFMRTRLSRFLTASRFMRNAYGLAKTSAFVLAGAAVALAAPGSGAASSSLSVLQAALSASVACAVGLCVVRGIPVIVDGVEFVRAMPAPPHQGRRPMRGNGATEA